MFYFVGNLYVIREVLKYRDLSTSLFIINIYEIGIKIFENFVFFFS